MIKWENISYRLGTWANEIKPFWEAGGFNKIYEFLKKESSEGKRIAPDSEDVYRCFIKTPLKDIKVCILGLCPYHSERDGECIADGLAMSCSKTGVLQPSLEKFYEALEEEFKNGLCLQCDKDPDLSYLAEQGVLLFNSALTVEIGKPKSHNSIWEPFTKHVMSIIGRMDIPVIFLGNEASMFGSYIKKESNKYFLKHPAWASYKKTKWDTEFAFTEINRILEGKKQEPIDWMESSPF
jgi:uracil-DNA glycosylase